jgi:CheY-like chemotaxis protein
MIIPVVPLPVAAAGSAPIKKRRVLLVDTSRAKRDMRAETLRRLGVEVDCAADISEARAWWRPELYNLVLFHVQTELPQLQKFCDDIRAAVPAQQVAFLVGKPEYLAASPNSQSALPPGEDAEPLPDTRAALSNPPSTHAPQHWGILEACRRISAVRSVTDARSRALRERPLPVRDSDRRDRKLIPPELEAIAEIYSEETQ